MKTTLYLFAFLLTYTLPSYGQKDKTAIEASVIAFFDGLSEVNVDKLRTYSTSDFQLLENGEVWNLDTLINKITPKRTNMQRLNKFHFIKTEQRRNIAWVTYFNTADFKMNDRQQTVKWLESAVLIKEKGKWKINMMHSTRMK